MVSVSLFEIVSRHCCYVGLVDNVVCQESALVRIIFLFPTLAAFFLGRFLFLLRIQDLCKYQCNARV